MSEETKTGLAIIPETGQLDYSNKGVMNTIKQNVCPPNATAAEFALFIAYCQSTGLNPLKKEVWFIKTSRGVQILTGINGFIGIANKNPQFDGMTAPEYLKDEYGDYCKVEVHRKDRKIPSTGLAYIKEFRGKTPIWNEKTRHMLAKVAKSIALREAFPQELNGLYTEDEYYARGGEREAASAAAVELQDNIDQTPEFSAEDENQDSEDRPNPQDILAEMQTADEIEGEQAQA